MSVEHNPPYEPNWSASQSGYSGSQPSDQLDDNGAEVSETVDGPSTTQADDWQDWQTLDFPNAMSVDAIAGQSNESADPSSADWLDHAIPHSATNSELWANAADQAAEQPKLSDLVALIQELNQCNDVLLNRVSQLEEALERSQVALQAQAERPSVPEADFVRVTEELAATNHELSATHAQVIQLSNELEFSQQTTQRQDILIDTLKGQLENSQERVAQLERECSLTQQRYNEQLHQLAQSESLCRDLQTRLLRQQRYTLQFKAALEKCLEVPPPSYEAKSEAVSRGADSRLQPDVQDTRLSPLLLPKVQKIQPWSAHPHFPNDLAIAVEESAIEPSSNSDGGAPFRPDSAQSLDLPAVVSSITQFPNLSAMLDEQAGAVEEEPPAPASAPQPAVSYDLKKTANWWANIIRPRRVADSSDEAAAPEESPIEEVTLNSVESPQPAEAVDLERTDEWSSEPIEAEVEEVAASLPDETVVQPPVEAEDMLWQDLARLIDVSTEDVVKASLSEEYQDFEEAIALEPAQPKPQDESVGHQLEKPLPTLLSLKQQIAELSIPSTANSESTTPEPAPVAKQSDPDSQKPQTPAQPIPEGFSPHANWPSPIVYPLRTPKKIESLAAVKLPTFPR